jgi:hypothetical protein
MPSTAHTPVDMTHYAEHARMRPEPIPAPVPAAASRFSIARRPLLDLPMAVGGAPAQSAATAPMAGPDSSALTMHLDEEEPRMQPAATVETLTDPDFDLSSTFDVPAFLRRQEG